MNANNITIMLEGKIVKMGTYKALIKLDRWYLALVHAQDLRGTQEKAAKYHKNLDSRDDDKKELKVMYIKTRQDLENGVNLTQLEKGETLGYLLIYYLYIMFSKQHQLYLVLFISVLTSLVSSSTYPT